MPPPPVTPTTGGSSRRAGNERRLSHPSPTPRRHPLASVIRGKENIPPESSSRVRRQALATTQTPPPTQTLPPPPSTQPRLAPSSLSTSAADEYEDEGEDELDELEHDPDDLTQEDKDMLHALDANASQALRAVTGTQEFYEAACIAVRFLGHYPNHVRVLTEGLTYIVNNIPSEARPLNTSDEYNPSVETDIVWDAVEIFLPKLIKCASYILRHDDLIARIAHYLELVTKYVRGNDFQRIKPNIMKIADIPDPASIFEDKSNRGWNANEFAELLVPLTELETFRADPAGYCAKVITGQKVILSDDWPVCFYDLKKVQPGKAKPGFLKSLILDRCYRWLITGKGSAFLQYNWTRKSRGKPSVAQNGEVNFVTLPSILYVACIARNCLTSSTTWCDVDGAHWNAEEFVKSVYQAVFHDPEWADELEDWWTKRIYGTGEEENEVVVEKRKDTALKRFLQECDGGNPRKRAKPNTPSTSSSS
ncbi:hypothetical protein C8T65DRAFT_671314 [Cerioporus squamosus]|nr:hypothetical protein C8T65DRAFT_671314 [Cerioporus squamosus]